MRFFCFSTFCLVFCFTTSTRAHAQSPNPSSFQQQAQAAASAGKPFSGMNLTATAEWTAGSLHESGTAQLEAHVDGSTNVQLALGKASRTEVQTKADSSRTCSWTDNAGKSHNVSGASCFGAIPWFSPSLFTQPSAGLASKDDGVVTQNGSTYHQVDYLLNLPGANSLSTSQMASLGTVKVSYDPQTSLPVTLEYFIHPDNNDLANIPVRIAFSNYQSVSGIMIPYHIERFINNTLQLKLDVSNASVE